MNFSIDAPIIEKIGYPNFLFVDQGADRPLKEHLAVFATYFKREMGFTSLQFDEFMFDNEDYVGFLILQRATDLVEHDDHYPCRVVGGGIFAECGGNYELDWVWLHPFSRNKGLLGDCWERFRERFGQFSVGRPLSAQMKAFLDRRPVAP